MNISITNQEDTEKYSQAEPIAFLSSLTLKGPLHIWDVSSGELRVSFRGEPWERSSCGRARWHCALSPAWRGPGSSCQQRPSTNSQASNGPCGLSTKNNSLQKYQKWSCPRIICKISPAPCIFNEIKVFSIVQMSGFGPDKQVTETECWVSWMQTGIKLGKKCRSHLSDFNPGEINSKADVRKEYFSRHGLI